MKGRQPGIGYRKSVIEPRHTEQAWSQWREENLASTARAIPTATLMACGDVPPTRLADKRSPKISSRPPDAG